MTMTRSPLLLLRITLNLSLLFFFFYLVCFLYISFNLSSFYDRFIIIILWENGLLVVLVVVDSNVEEVGRGSPSIYIKLHQISRVAQCLRDFSRKSLICNQYIHSQGIRGMVGSFKLPFCKKLFDILYISFTKDWCERTSASTDLQMLRLF